MSFRFNSGLLENGEKSTIWLRAGICRRVPSLAVIKWPALSSEYSLFLLSCHTAPNERLLQRALAAIGWQGNGCHTASNEYFLQWIGAYTGVRPYVLLYHPEKLAIELMTFLFFR